MHFVQERLLKMCCELRGWLLVFGLLLGAGVVARAQSSATGEIRGTITDQTGAVVPNATISVTNINTGELKTFTSNNVGLYDTVSTPNGSYLVTITAPGFENLVLGPITLDVGVITLNGTLNVGSSRQRVVVRADTAALLQTESGEQSTTFDEKTMQQLPQVGADWANFTILLPGSAGASSTGNAVTNPGVSVSVNGSMPYSNNFLSDGGSVTNPHSSDVETDTFDTVAEVHIEDSNFSAQYGIGGAVFNQITKGGTNHFHGSAYEHFQNDALEARSYFTDPTQPIPPLKFNQFGGSIGGPILRNRMFFFFNYDKTIDNQNYTEFTTMPTDQMKGVNTPNGQFDLTQLLVLDGNGNKIPVTDGNGNNIINPCTNNVVYQGELFDPSTQTTVGGQMCRYPFATDNVIPANRIDTVAKNLLKYFPEPNQNVSGGIINDYYAVIPTPYPSTRIFGRIDYDFNDKNRLTSSIAVRDANSPVYSEWNCPVACYHDDTSDYSSQTSDVWSFSSTFVNEARFSFNRQGSFLTPYSLGAGIPASIGLQYAKADVFPNINIYGTCCDSPYAGTNTIYAQNVYQPSDVVTLIRGKHVLHFGGEVIMLEDNSTNWGNVDAGDFTFSGQYTQASLAASGSGGAWADFLLGDMQSWGAANSPLFGGRQKDPQIFIQDDIKLRPNLTVNLGLRYQIQGGWSEVHGRMGDFDPTIFNTASGNYGAMWFAPANHRTQAQANVYTGFLPRVGFAYSLDNSTVIRGGWGMYSSPWSVDQYGNAKGVGYSQSGSAQDLTNGVTPVATLSGPGAYYGTTTQLPYVNASTSPTAYNGQNTPNYDPYHTPLTYLYSWSLGVQHEFKYGITSEVSYVGKHGANMQFKADINQVPVQNLSANDNPSGRPFPQYQSIGGSTFNGVSNYNSLQAQVNKRLANGIAFSSAYTWSKFLNDMDVSPFNGQGGTINFQNAHDVGSNYGPSNFDIRESLKSSVVYQLPFGVGRRWLNKNRLLDEAIGGWQVSAIVINQTGNPFTVTYNGANNSYSQAGAWYPNVLRNAQVGIKKSINEWYDPTAYSIAPNATFGDSRRNSLRAPGIDTANLSMGKTFHFTEGVGLQFRADASNVFNHPDFGAPDGNFNDPVNPDPYRPSGAGTISSTTVGGRNMQISAQITF
jgi:hypothetical protein